MLKKISIAIILLSSSVSLYAGRPDSPIGPLGENVTAPPSYSSWSFGIEGLYMAPTNADFQYARISDLSSPTANNTNKSVTPEHSIGGEFDATYHFAGNSRDLGVALTHVDMDSDSSTTLVSGQISDPFGLSNASTNYAKADMDNSVDAVDVVFGQRFDVGERVTMRVFGGLRYADLESNNLGRYFDTTATTQLQGYGRVNTEFDGLGPRAGVDAAVHVGSGISVVSTVGVSLLKGSIDTKITRAPEGAEAEVFDNTGEHHTVPEMDAKLGLNYHHAINTTNSFDLEVGYKVVNYFDVIDTDYIDATTPNSINNTNDLGYHGPYFRAQLNII